MPSRVEASAAQRRRWRDLAWRVWTGLSSKHLSMMAAGVAFYGFLALFPGLIALVSVYGLVADPVVVEANIASLGGILPDAAQSVVDEQLKAITAHSGTTLSFALLFSLGFALWSAASGMKAMMEALNIAYGDNEQRGFIHFNVIALCLTFGAILMLIVALFGVVVVPIGLKMLDALRMPDEIGQLLALARWPVLAAFIMAALAILYRFGPCHEHPRLRWVSWGAVTTTALWLLGSALFSYYVSTFETYNKTYGSLAAIVVLLLWLEISAYLVILGAQLNAELEREPERNGDPPGPV